MRAAVACSAPLALVSKVLTASIYLNDNNDLIGVARVRLRLSHTLEVSSC